MRIGVAAHITAASSGGPRFNALMDSDARSDISNGIWLCQTCARIIDTAPEAFTVDGLRAWKNHAELFAARDSSRSADEIAILLADISDTCATLLNFCEHWQENEPGILFHQPYEERTKLIIAQHNARVNAYHREVEPYIKSIIVRASATLGDEAAIIVELKHEAMAGSTNYIGMRELASCLRQLQALLSLR